jgi:hypothetical protein
LVDICNTPWDYALKDEARRIVPQAKTVNSCPQAPEECRQFEQWTDRINLQRQNANCDVGLSTADFRLSRFRPAAATSIKPQAL